MNPGRKIFAFLGVICVALLLALLALYNYKQTPQIATNLGGFLEEMELESPAFAGTDMVPGRYTCDGVNINPPFVFRRVPADAKSLAILVYDPDGSSGEFTHWIVWNIATSTAGIAENSLPPGALQGLNSANKAGYTGPCPSSGDHRYVFKLFALSETLTLTASSTRAQFDHAIREKVVSTAELVRSYIKKGI